MLAAVPILCHAQAADEWTRLNHAGRAAETEGDYARAAAVYRDSARVAETFAPTDPRRAGSYNSLGMVENALGNFADAETAYRRALAALPAKSPAKAIDRATVLANLGALYLDFGLPERAERPLRESIALHETASPPDPARHAAARNALAEYFILTRRYREAEALLTFAIHGSSPEASAVALTNLGAMRLAQSRLPEAVQMLQDSVAALEQLHGIQHPALLRALNNLATAQIRSHYVAEAGKNFRRAVDLAGQYLGDQSQLYGQVLANYAAYLRQTGEKAQGRDLAKRAGQILHDTARRNGIGATVDVSALR
jgi:tetratricopeptide (TPR) repeat protein